MQWRGESLQSATSNCGEVISLDNIFSLLATLIGGGFLGHIISGKKNSNDDKQEIINQLQEERKWTSDQLKERDEKIDALWERFRQLEKDYGELIHEKREIEWKWKRAEAEKELLQEEVNKLNVVIEKKDLQIERLEKELVLTK